MGYIKISKMAARGSEFYFKILGYLAVFLGKRKTFGAQKKPSKPQENSHYLTISMV